MIVLFVNYVEECLQLTVACNRKQDHVASTKVEGTFVDQQLLIVADGQRRLVLAYWFTNEWRRCIRIVRHVSFGHFDFYNVIFGPAVMEVDRVFTSCRSEQWSNSTLKESRLQEETFACSLGIRRKINVVRDK